MRPVLALLLLAGCVSQQQISARDFDPPPTTLTQCYQPHPLPKPPPPPRSAQAVIDWARALQEVAITNSANLIDCAERIAHLNAWINDRTARERPQ
jgi:hypothetical protein